MPMSFDFTYVITDGTGACSSQSIFECSSVGKMYSLL
jgi:hypothetical protein